MYANEFSTVGKGGRVDFWPVGDVVELCDGLRDGRSAKLGVFDQTGFFTKYEIEASCYGKYTKVSALRGSYLNLAENHCFKFEMYLLDGDGDIVPGSEDDACWRNRNDAKVNCDP
ncbi:hypothetical protein M2271_006536 [Streptomyces sp. LBL]|uniref:hypothetical protein n=1 Tax=Streptomyces sp. LBL TaxID=2940562 RepID=UPI002476DDD7|nr:hypothetical protein [Streptomyces sp. LBL]MDH6628703.1 hypothetical protein [Streptomyces sp. LBL]